MQLHISEKNSKIGAIPNISLTTGVSCVPGIPCYREGCYARNSYRRFAAVRKNWDENLKFYQTQPTTFFNLLDDWLIRNRPERFRLFVGGDFPDEEFYRRVSDVIKYHEETKFLAFTKRYGYNYDTRPENLQIILSTWPGVELPKRTDLPWAWLEEDERRPKENFFMCGGGCTDCRHMCWDNISGELPVVFRRH